MPLPDICLVSGSNPDNENAQGIGQPDSPGGGIGVGGVITPGDGVAYTGEIGNLRCNRPVISAVSGSKVKYTIQLKYVNDQPVDLSNVSSVKFVAKETYDAISYYLNKTCTIVDAANGMITLQLKPADIPYAGVWLAAFMLYNGEDALISQYDVYLYIKKSLNSAECQNYVITVAEVRYALLDRCPEENALLDDFEFSDSEIMFAIMRPVDEWNETPPIIQNYQYTAATFPYRYHWLDATCAELLKMTSRKLIRNKLDYNAGGVAVNDKSRAPIYAQLAEQMHMEYIRWMRLEKARINAENCYGGLRSRVYF